MRRLGSRQLGVLRGLIEHGSWSETGPWSWNGVAETSDVLIKLARYGLAEIRGDGTAVPTAAGIASLEWNERRRRRKPTPPEEVEKRVALRMERIAERRERLLDEMATATREELGILIDLAAQGLEADELLAKWRILRSWIESQKGIRSSSTSR